MTSTTKNLSRTEREDLLRMFELFDTEQTGTLSVLEFKSVLQQVAKEKERPALQRLLAAPIFQSQTDRRLTQQEFLQLLTQDNDQPDDEVRRVFALFDTENKGFITVDDLRHIATDLGEKMGEEELQEMIQRAASQGGRVSFHDFEAVLNHQLMTSF